MYHDIKFRNWPRSTSHQTWAQNISFIRLFTQKQTKNGLLYFLSFWAEDQNFVESKKTTKAINPSCIKSQIFAKASKMQKNKKNWNKKSSDWSCSGRSLFKFHQCLAPWCCIVQPKFCCIQPKTCCIPSMKWKLELNWTFLFSQLKQALLILPTLAYISRV